MGEAINADVPAEIQAKRDAARNPRPPAPPAPPAAGGAPGAGGAVPGIQPQANAGGGIDAGMAKLIAINEEQLRVMKDGIGSPFLPPPGPNPVGPRRS
jgi:hypothetical protein